MLNFRINIDEEVKILLKEFNSEIKQLNEHLSDVKQMIAPCLGFKVKVTNIKK